MKDQVVIVTGSGQGIGEATALRFSSEGASVVVVDIQEASGNGTVQEIQRQGGKACFVRADVSNPNDVRNMAEQAVAAFGKIDVLVNVAGVQGMVADVVELPEDEWYHVLNVNLTSVYLCSKYCIPYMLEQGGGCIVNIASMQSFLTCPDHRRMPLRRAESSH